MGYFIDRREQSIFFTLFSRHSLGISILYQQRYLMLSVKILVAVRLVNSNTNILHDTLAYLSVTACYFCQIAAYGGYFTISIYETLAADWETVNFACVFPPPTAFPKK